MIKIVPFIYNNDFEELCSNTYVLIDDAKNCVIVDPSKSNDKVKEYIKANKLKAKAVLLTHGHFDHFKGASILTEGFKIPLYIDAEDEEMIRSTFLNCSHEFETSVIFGGETTFFPRNGVLKLLKEELLVIPTPYHTKGSVCFYSKNNSFLISGDTLFKNGIGRADLPNNASKEKNNTLQKLFSLPDDTKVYPGHGPLTNIKDERILNQFVK